MKPQKKEKKTYSLPTRILAFVLIFLVASGLITFLIYLGMDIFG